jgi:hypothetical protein
MLLIMIMTAAPALHAQSVMGTITGMVTDTSGAVIPAAQVVARNTSTGVEMRAVSSSTGNYVLQNLQVGTYDVSVSNAGFKTWSRAGLALSSNETLRADAVLEIGQVSERVVVTAAAPPLRTESTEVSTTMENNLVQNVPLPMAGIGGGMRNAFNIMMMMPQVKSGNGEGAWDDFQIGGGQQHDWNVAVDGLSVEMGWRNHVGYMNRLTPPIDGVEEFRIETATFKAEDSRASGGMITIVTKSGTNELHGSAFDYYQSQKFNANSWRNNKLGRARSVFHRNDFGGTAGGPVYIPKVYNGKDKTYFYFSYEGYRFPQTSDIGELTIPLAEMKQGDFSRWVDDKGNMIPIYDPSTTRTVDGKIVRDPFPGNMIPQNRLSPIALNIAKYLPDPTVPGLVRNYRMTGNQPRKRIENAYMTKLDHAFGSSNRLAFTWTKNGYYWNNAYDQDPLNPNNWGGNVLPWPLASPSGDRHYHKGDQYYGNVFRLNDTHVVSPSVVNTLTLGFHRLTHPEHDVTTNTENWGQVLGGVKNNPGNNAHFPAVFFNTDNYYGWETTKFWDEYHNVFGLEENVSWVKANHSFKFGYTYQNLMLNRDDHNNEAGTFNFHRLGTAAPLDNTGASGNAFASFMLGQVQSGNFTVPRATLMRWPYHAFFAQDDWKITPRLTANIGFRFEMNMPVYEKHDRISYFDANLPNPAASGYPGALRFVGQGEGRSGARTFYPIAKGYGPRLGFAYQLNDNTVVRAGGGIFYAPIKFSPSNAGFTAGPGWSSADQGVSPAFDWDDGFPAWQVPPFINPGFNAGQSVTWAFENDLGKLPTNYTWNFAVQRALPGQFVLDLTYTGNKGTFLASDRVNYMQIDPRYAHLGSLLNRPIDDPEVVRLGFRPPFANFRELLGSRATLGQSLRMFPQYSGVGTGGMQNHSGNSTYHAMIVKLSKRYSHGLSLVSSYTWSKMLSDADSAEPWIAGVVGAGIGAGGAQNHYNRSVEKSYSVLDIPHMFKLTAAYDLPFGKGKPFLADNSVLGYVLGNWNVAAFVFAQSGYPLGVIDTGYQNFLNAGTPRPHVLTHDWRAPVSGSEFDPDKDLMLDRSAFVRRTNPALDPFGDAPRFNGVTRMFGRVRENVNITRQFPVFERVRMDFRWEIYNLFNHHTWSRPDSLDLANTQFGKITNAEGNRTMQFGLKLVF